VNDTGWTLEWVSLTRKVVIELIEFDLLFVLKNRPDKLILRILARLKKRLRFFFKRFIAIVDLVEQRYPPVFLNFDFSL